MIINNELPDGWRESCVGGIATNNCPETGGIVDTAILSGEWFLIMEGYLTVDQTFATRADALNAYLVLRGLEAEGFMLTGNELAFFRSSADLLRECSRTVPGTCLVVPNERLVAIAADTQEGITPLLVTEMDAQAPITTLNADVGAGLGTITLALAISAARFIGAELAHGFDDHSIEKVVSAELQPTKAHKHPKDALKPR